MLTRAPYDKLRQSFRWNLPDRLNMAEQVCDRWATKDPERTAIIDLTGPRRDFSFAELRALAAENAREALSRAAHAWKGAAAGVAADRLADALLRLEFGPGDEGVDPETRLAVVEARADAADRALRDAGRSLSEST